MKKIIYFIFILVCISFIFSFSALNITLSDPCSISHPLLEQKIIASDIDKIQVTIYKCNPKYGNDSKIITNTEEIKNMVETFNTAETGLKVDDSNFEIGGASAYYFFSNNNLIYKFCFNGSNSKRIFIDNSLYYVHYNSRNTPYDLYNNSPSEIIAVDDSLNIINN